MQELSLFSPELPCPHCYGVSRGHSTADTTSRGPSPSLQPCPYTPQDLPTLAGASVSPRCWGPRGTAAPHSHPESLPLLPFLWLFSNSEASHFPSPITPAQCPPSGCARSAASPHCPTPKGDSRINTEPRGLCWGRTWQQGEPLPEESVLSALGALGGAQ